MRPLFEKQPRSTAGAMTVTTATPSATAQRYNGWAVDASGVPHVISIGSSAVPATAIKFQGLAFSPLGALYVTDNVVE